MGAHIVNGQFQSDKYPTCPPGKVPLSVRDVTAQDLLWEYAQRRRAVDAEFADDLETALTAAGYVRAPRAEPVLEIQRCTCGANLVTVGLAGDVTHREDCALLRPIFPSTGWTARGLP